MNITNVINKHTINIQLAVVSRRVRVGVLKTEATTFINLLFLITYA